MTTATLKLIGVLISRVTVEKRTHVEMLVSEDISEWLRSNGWAYQRIVAKRSEWFDVVADGLKMRFELAQALHLRGRWVLRFSSRTPNHAAIALAHRVGQVAGDVKIKRGPVGKQMTMEDRAAKARGPKRVTVEGLPNPAEGDTGT